MFKINSEYLYAKVMDKTEDGYCIRFTSYIKDIL